MASEAQAQIQSCSPSNSPPVIPFGYFRCKKRIALLQRFQCLLRHYEFLHTDPATVPPLATLLPPNTKPENQRQALEREINKSLMPVSLILRDAGVQTSFTHCRQKSQDPFQLHPKAPEIETIHFDVILQYFYVGNMKISRNDNFQAVIRVTDQAVGCYEYRQANAFKEIFNPAIWIAHLIRLPIWILQRAGFAPNQKFYEGFIKTLVALIFMLLLIHYGILSWNDLTTLLPK
jgi:hypothetical protein